jgi:tight adherence protein B
VRRRVVLAASLASLVLGGSAAAAVDLRQLDAGSYPTVRVSLVTGKPTETAPTLRENGRPAAGFQAENLGLQKSIVVAIDRSKSMKGQPLADAVAAAKAFVAAKEAGDRVAIVSFGAEAVQQTRFSTATIDADGALRVSLAQREGTALYDAVALSADALSAERGARRLIVVLTDGRDLSSAVTPAQAVRAARRANASVYAIGIAGPQFSPGPLRRLARETGGAYFQASSSRELTRIYAGLARDLKRTWRLEFVTAARPGEALRLEAAVPGQGSAKGTFRIPGGRAGGPATGDDTGLLPGGFARSAAAPAVAALLTGLLVLLAVVLVLRRPRSEWVRERVAAHVGAPRPRTERSRRDLRPAALLASLYGVTERTFGKQRTWERIQSLLERADLPLRTAEFFYLSGGLAVAGFFLFLAAGASPLLLLIALVAAGLAPLAFVWLKAERRVRAFEAQLPDLLLTLAASLRAGHSLRQGIQSLVADTPPPASKEFRRVLAEASLGRPVEDALGEMSKRLGSADFEYVVAAVTIQREVGGALAALLEMVAETVRSRQQFRRKVRALTAMGRLSAYILIALPFVVAFAISLLNPGYMDPLFNSSAGHKIIVIGLSMMLFGSLVLRKVVSFKG